MAQSQLTVDELAKLFSVLSHDLKSPIFSIDGFSDLLLSDYGDRLDDEGRDFLQRIRSSAQQVKKVLDEMSQMVKLLNSALAPRPTDLKELLEEIRLKQNFMIEDGAVEFVVSGDLQTLNVDREKTREALGALISNAVFFNDRPKGERRVEVNATAENGEHRVCIKDNGIGIDERYLAQVFDLGIKLDKSRGGGPGYGLYLARRVAESHGGRIEATSVPDQGSTFCFVVPG